MFTQKNPQIVNFNPSHLPVTWNPEYPPGGGGEGSRVASKERFF